MLTSTIKSMESVETREDRRVKILTIFVLHDKSNDIARGSERVCVIICVCIAHLIFERRKSCIVI